MVILSTLFFLGLAAAGVPQSGGGFHPITDFDGPAPNARFGQTSAVVGDVNQDGYADIAIGSAKSDPNGLQNAGSVFVYSGMDGTLLYQFDGAQAGDQLGWSVAGAGDVNNDTFDDILAGAYAASPGGVIFAGSVYVYSGLDGSTLYQLDGAAARDVLGYAVDGAGDVNNDNFDDFIASAVAADPNAIVDAGTVYVYSGFDGSVLTQYDGTQSEEYFGQAVSGAGDLNNDFSAEIIIGDPLADANGLPDAGSAYVYSGIDGTLMYQFDGAGQGDALGSAVSDAGDVNNDGFNDVVVGAPRDGNAGVPLAGRIYVFSGLDGSLLFRFIGEFEGGLLGSSVAAAGDVNNDGRADVIAGAPNAKINSKAFAGTAYVVSGATGNALGRLDGETVRGHLGTSVGGNGDFTGDQIADVLVGIPDEAPGGVSRAGQVTTFSFDPYLAISAQSISAAAGGTISFEIEFPATEAGNSYSLLFSATGIGPVDMDGILVPLTPDWLFNKAVAGNYPALFVDPTGILDAAGEATASLVAAPNELGPYVSQSFWVAAVSRDAITQDVVLSTVSYVVSIDP